MMEDKDIQAMEKKVFRATVNDGLADMRAGFILSLFAIAPLLSPTLGDFWSSAVWLPLYLAFDILLRLIKQRAVMPRMGTVRFGPARKARIRRTMMILLAANLVSFIAGLVFFLKFNKGFRPSVWTVSAGLALSLMVVFTAAGLMLQLNRFFIYGIGTAIATLAGEWLFQTGLASHHGYPAAFGLSSIVLIGIGVVVLMNFLHHHPVRTEGKDHGRA
jgi:hypothetical protein